MLEMKCKYDSDCPQYSKCKSITDGNQTHSLCKFGDFLCPEVTDGYFTNSNVNESCVYVDALMYDLDEETIKEGFSKDIKPILQICGKSESCTTEKCNKNSDCFSGMCLNHKCINGDNLNYEIYRCSVDDQAKYFMKCKKVNDVSYDQSAINKIDPACDAETKKYEYCLTIPSEQNFDEDCKKISSEECQNFVSNVQTMFPSCQNDPVAKEILSSKVTEGTYKMISFICSKNEAGNQCPFSKHFSKSLNNNINQVDYTPNGEEQKVMEETCESDSCRKVTYDFVQYLIDEFKDSVEGLSVTQGKYDFNQISTLHRLTEYFNSDECKDMSKSGAVTLKISASLFISLGLLLLFLY
ncbi:hypothetical protein PIROE2DRAFT_65025 [Piromyces sp. E2]|nr:hypothetical protein PIROE2DRAFT_65025 [Piromyces sp. E2]|eukprot:OUM57414.1 hypothetical protein PIROE2DRAFT_65025 [Piromyces sp. E2]